MRTSPAMPLGAGRVSLGVDTQADVHVAAALDPVGRLLGTRTFSTTSGGYALLVAWARRHGVLACVHQSAHLRPRPPERLVHHHPGRRTSGGVD